MCDFLRQKADTAYKAHKFDVDIKYWDNQFLILQRLTNNESATKYPRALTSSATGLTPEQCQQVILDEFIEEVHREEEHPLSTIACSNLLDLGRKSNKIFRKLCTAVPHIPVMAGEVLQYLKPEGNQVILDMTFGAGGHSRRILAEAPNARILALDRDPTAMDYANKLAEEYPDRVTFLLGRFSELPALLANQGLGLNSIDGMLFDFGCSSMQFDTPNRGFAVSHNGPLDMRMDQGRFPAKPTAADVLERANEEDLYQIIKIYGEEKRLERLQGL